ncbi:hypothetical protein [Pseudovibrio sp. Tun.PSC04-5.I4]|uniref:hypothetical protein n=1 Tax=Pseudovibrio sp. Tun.PSC04-5.I4 TaxID=1798213 RepID=UPI00087FA8D6|nr:hypothetical protein [Pseudovibrio sp. Tun.PSC04-5.I4]SDR44931.1 hypothetical protein SAMN04515695_5477 [Pseudovibrio sp. Tun.PSC04-5.I4]
MISTPDRTTAVALINEAVTAGARRLMACGELEISERTFVSAGCILPKSAG